MEDNRTIHLTSIIITFVIFLTGAALSYWLYTEIIQGPGVASEKPSVSISIDSEKLEKVKAPQPPSISSPKENLGRTNPFMPYK